MIRTTIAAMLMCISLSSIAQNKPVAKPEEKISYEVPGAPMPKLMLVTLDSVTDMKKAHKKMKKTAGYMVSPYNTDMYTNEYFNKNAPLIVMMFNPTCGHCEAQTDDFVRLAGRFKETKLVLLANPQMKAYLPAFITTHQIKEQSAYLTLGVDSLDFIKNTFLYQALPQINVYGEDRKLIKAFSGNVPMDTLLQYIR